VFNSFHVSFIGHLDSLPSSLMPGAIVNIDDGNIPPLWDAVKFTAPQNPIPYATSPLIMIDENPDQRYNATQLQGPSAMTHETTRTTMDPVATATTPNSNIDVDHPPSPCPPIHSQPPLWRLTRIPVPTNRTRLPDLRLANSISDTIISGLCCKEERDTQHNTRLENLTEALIADFSRVHDFYKIIPINIDLENKSHTIDEAIMAISNGSIAPISDPGNDPSWVEALASPE
jgi:hypothetical protein